MINVQNTLCVDVFAPFVCSKYCVLKIQAIYIFHLLIIDLINHRNMSETTRMRLEIKISKLSQLAEGNCRKHCCWVGIISTFPNHTPTRLIKLKNWVNTTVRQNNSCQYFTWTGPFCATYFTIVRE